MDEQDGEGSRGNAGDACRLVKVFRLDFVEFFGDFCREAVDGAVVAGYRQAVRAVFFEFGDLTLLALDVAAVFGGDVDLFDDGFIELWRVETGQGGKGRVVDFRAFEQLACRKVLAEAGQVFLADEGVAQALLFARECFHFFVEYAVAVFVHHAERMADGGQARVGVVFAQE